MKYPPSPQAFGPAVNRFLDVMAHSDRYAFRGTTRLALDAGVTPGAVSKIIHGTRNPSFLMVMRLAQALERTFGFPIHPGDLIAESGLFLTRCACDLVGCPGCLPETASDEFGAIKPAFSGVKPGTWVTRNYPTGYPEKGAQ